MLELRHFQLVLAVAETGSLAAASRRLSLTPSALSHQLRDAEARLDAQLFQRRHRRLLLTGVGEQLVRAAGRVLDEVARAEASCRGGAAEDLVRISTACYTTYSWLPLVLPAWQAEFPRVELRIVLEATRRPLPALLAGALDLALITDPPRHARLRHRALGNDELRMIVPEGHRLAGRAHVTAAQLADEHVLTYDAPRDELDIFTRVLGPAGVEPRRTTRVPLTEALVELVRSGVGVAPLPSWLARGTRLPHLRITPRGVRRHWRAVHLAHRAPAPALLRFAELLRQHVAPELA